jgi:hypothetical protein
VRSAEPPDIDVQWGEESTESAATNTAQKTIADASPTPAVDEAPAADRQSATSATASEPAPVGVVPPQARAPEADLPSVIINVDADEEDNEHGEPATADVAAPAGFAVPVGSEALPGVGGDGLDIPVTMDPSSPELSVPVDIVEPEFPASSHPLLQRLGDRSNVVLGVGGVGVLLVLVIIILAVQPSPGTLVISALDSDGAQVDSVRVQVDGEERCARMPCMIEGIEAGAHLVRVVAPGGRGVAEQTTEVESGAKTHLSLTLGGLETPAPAARPVARAKPASDRTQADDEESDGEDEDEVTRTISAAKAGGKARKAATGKHRSAVKRDTSEVQVSGKKKAATSGTGSLIVMSQPSGVVSIDGRSVGSSPVTITLAAGPHNVTVRYADGAAHSVSVNVKADKSVSVMLNQ